MRGIFSRSKPTTTTITSLTRNSAPFHELNTTLPKRVRASAPLELPAHRTHRKQCQIVCSALYVSLPRELRDRVYELLMDRDRHVFPVNSMDLALAETTSTSVPWRLAQRYWYPQYLEAEYVGLEVRNEMVEAWYRGSMFCFPNLELIDGFLEWKEREHEGKTNLLDPSALVTNVDVHIKESEIMWDATTEELATSFSSGTSDRLRDGALQRLLLNLEKLFLFKAGTRITVSLVITGKLLYLRSTNEKELLLNGFAFIFPTLRRLQQTGYRVVVSAQWGMIRSRLDDVSEERCQAWIQGILDLAEVSPCQLSKRRVANAA